MGMRTIVHTIPGFLVSLVEMLRARLRDMEFCARHRIRPEDITRNRQLTFPILMLFILQKTVKSIQRHLHEFLDELAAGALFEPVSSGAVTHARAKLKASAFIELNQDCVLPTIYGAEHPIQRWRGHRLLGVDSSLVRLPTSPELGQTFGWKAAANQHGATGTRFPEARLSVLYDLLNRVGWEARLEPSTLGEVARSMIAVSPATRIWLSCGSGTRRILLRAVRRVPFGRRRRCFVSTEPTKAEWSGSLHRPTRRRSACDWACP